MVSQERKLNLVRSINKLDAYQEIQNQMGRAIVAVNFCRADNILSHFALDRDDVSLELADEGLFVGREAVTAIVTDTFGGPAQPGEMVDLHLTTPMIEVADDLETARAVWWCPGAGATASAAVPEAIWIWGFIAADFVPADDTWKIWHLHYFRFIRCSYEKGWVEDLSMINRPNKPLHPLSMPTSYHNPYSPLSVRDGVPAVPRPYRTYDDIGWMLDRDKSR